MSFAHQLRMLARRAYAWRLFGLPVLVYLLAPLAGVLLGAGVETLAGLSAVVPVGLAVIAGGFVVGVAGLLAYRVSWPPSEALRLVPWSVPLFWPSAPLAGPFRPPRLPR